MILRRQTAKEREAALVSEAFGRAVDSAFSIYEWHAEYMIRDLERLMRSRRTEWWREPAKLTQAMSRLYGEGAITLERRLALSVAQEAKSQAPVQSLQDVITALVRSLSEPRTQAPQPEA